MGKRDKGKKKSNRKWVIIISIWAFMLAVGMSAFAESILPRAGILLALAVLTLLIGASVLFDIIGIAVACADTAPFHSMNSKNVKGARAALFLIANAEKVANFCNDVVGDILGIISGGAAVIIVSKLVAAFNFNLFITTIVASGMVAAVTIAGKAAGKSVAMNKSFDIIYVCGIVLHHLGVQKTKRVKRNRK